MEMMIKPMIKVIKNQVHRLLMVSRIVLGLGGVAMHIKVANITQVHMRKKFWISVFNILIIPHNL